MSYPFTRTVPSSIPHGLMLVDFPGAGASSELDGPFSRVRGLMSSMDRPVARPGLSPYALPDEGQALLGHSVRTGRGKPIPVCRETQRRGPLGLTERERGIPIRISPRRGSSDRRFRHFGGLANGGSPFGHTPYARYAGFGQAPCHGYIPQNPEHYPWRLWSTV